jgi:DNA-binding CsgD family transcriptional regulator
VLAAAGEQEPLLVVVDDAQWLDAESRQLLVFVARRLLTEQVGMLMAFRDDPGALSPAHDLPVLALGGLSEAECRELAAARGLAVDDRAVARAARATGGNPLALLETLLHQPKHPPALAGPEQITVGATVDRAWRLVLDRLPERTRQALFLLAAARPTGLAPLPALLDAVGLSLDDVAPAERDGLVVVDVTGAALRHPLLRQVLVNATPLAVRSRIYLALAGAATAEQRAWYLSLATFGPDEEVATALIAAAADARRRGAWATASTLQKRAADLSCTAPAWAERLVRAGSDALEAGCIDNAEQWCAEVRSSGPEMPLAADAALVRTRALSWLGRSADAVSEALGVAEASAGPAPRQAARLLGVAVSVAAAIGDARSCLKAARRLEALPAEGEVDFAVRTMVAAGHLMHGAVPVGRTRLTNVRPEPPDDAGLLATYAECQLWLEDIDAARSTVDAAVDRARAERNIGLLARALAVRSEVGYRTGQWVGAYADATESLQWAEEARQRVMVGHGLLALARIEAARGQRALCEEHVQRCGQELDALGVDGLRAHAAAVLGLAALTWGEPGTAGRQLEAARNAAEEQGLGLATTLPLLSDLIEAHIRSGHPERARELLDQLEELAGSGGLSRLEAAAHRCRGLLADDVDEATVEFAAASKALDHGDCLFEHARTLLCEGEVLRRARRPAAARDSLREALAGFDALGARPWAQRAAGELAASGGRSPAQRAAGELTALEDLTPQELQIARMIATGRSNAELAAALFLSSKTVEAHLTRIYRKLHIRSRTDLARMVLTVS